MWRTSGDHPQELLWKDLVLWKSLGLAQYGAGTKGSGQLDEKTTKGSLCCRPWAPPPAGFLFAPQESHTLQRQMRSHGCSEQAREKPELLHTLNAAVSGASSLGTRPERAAIWGCGCGRNIYEMAFPNV